MLVLNSNGNCYFNYGNWTAKQTFRKIEVKKGIETVMQHTEKKFEIGYFECSISSTKQPWKVNLKWLQTAIRRN